MSENSPRRQDSRHSNPVRDTPTSRRDDGSSTRSAPPNRPSNNNISEDRLRSPGQSTSSSSRNPKPGDTNKSPGGKGRDSNIGSPVRASGQSAGKNASSPSRSLPFRDRGEGSSLGVSGAMGHDRQNRESQESQRSRKERPSNLGRPKPPSAVQPAPKSGKGTDSIFPAPQLLQNKISPSTSSSNSSPTTNTSATSRDSVQSPENQYSSNKDAGSEIRLRTNSFPITFPAKTYFYRYSIEVNPVLTEMRLSKRAFNKLFEKAKLIERRDTWIATDFKTTVYTTHQLEQSSKKSSNPLTFDVEVEIWNKLAESKTIKYQFKVTQPKQFPASDLPKLLLKDGAETDIRKMSIAKSQLPNAPDWMTPPGIGSISYPSLEEYKLGDLGRGLIGLQWYQTNLRVSDNKLLATVETKSACCFQAGPLDTVMNALIGSGANLDQLKSYLTGVQIRLIHLDSRDGKPRLKTIKTLGLTSEKQSFVRAGKTETVAEYFKKVHKGKFDTLDPILPVVNVGSVKRPIFFPAEVCEVLPRQNAGRLLTHDGNRKLATLLQAQDNRSHTKTPSKSQETLSPEMNMNVFGLNIEDKSLQPMSSAGRVLQVPELRYKDAQLSPDFGSWNVNENRLFSKTSAVKDWSSVIVQSTNKDPLGGILAKQMDKIYQLMSRNGCDVSKHRPAYPSLILDDASLEKRFSLLDSFFKQYAEDIATLVVVLSNNHQITHAMIKYLADCKYGINTICFESSELLKKTATIETAKLDQKVKKLQGQKTVGQRHDWLTASMAQKINSKCGVVNHALADSALRMLPNKNTMIVGIDTARYPQTCNKKTPVDIVSVVASRDSSCTQWPASVCRLDDSKTSKLNIQEMMNERLRFWRSEHEKFPDNMLIYRSGSPQQQNNAHLEKELLTLESSITKLYQQSETPPPRITFIVASKSTHGRFYPCDKDDSKATDPQSNGNTRNAILINGAGDMNKGGPFDFHLQAHHSHAPSVVQVHYTVLRHDTTMKDSSLQQFTHNLSYLYARGTVAVSLPPPLIYASLVCRRAKDFLRACRYSGSGGGVHGVECDCVGEREAWCAGVHERLGGQMWYIQVEDGRGLGIGGRGGGKEEGGRERRQGV